MLNKRVISLLYFCLISIFCVAQYPYVEAKLDTNSILIGEQTNISLSVYYSNENAKIDFPIITDTLHKNVEVIETSGIDTLRSSDHFILQTRVTLTSFDSGYFAIKPFQFKVDEKVLLSEALLIEVENVRIDSTNAVLYDIKGVYDDPLTFGEFMNEYGYKMAGGIGILAVLTYLSWFFFVKRAPILEVVKKPEPSIPDHETALARLISLKDQQLWQNGKDKAYHSELTETLRVYLESRFKVSAMGQTSDEIIQQMRFADISEDSRSEFVRILKLADMVKFAKEKPSANENEKMMDLAVEFIENTKRTEIIKEELEEIEA